MHRAEGVAAWILACAFCAIPDTLPRSLAGQVVECAIIKANVFGRPCKSFAVEGGSGSVESSQVCASSYGRS